MINVVSFGICFSKSYSLIPQKANAPLPISVIKFGSSVRFFKLLPAKAWLEIDFKFVGKLIFSRL